MHGTDSVNVLKNIAVRSLVIVIDVQKELTASSLRVEEGLTVYPEDACIMFLRYGGGSSIELISFVFHHRLTFTVTTLRTLNRILQACNEPYVTNSLRCQSLFSFYKRLKFYGAQFSLPSSPDPATSLANPSTTSLHIILTCILILSFFLCLDLHATYLLQFSYKT